MSQLENMSYKDQLTKLGNRFAMEKYINEIDAEKSIGVVYCDITGLKRVNDSMGHEAGDQLILRACDSLKKHLESMVCSVSVEMNCLRCVQELNMRH